MWLEEFQPFSFVSELPDKRVCVGASECQRFIWFIWFIHSKFMCFHDQFSIAIFRFRATIGVMEPQPLNSPGLVPSASGPRSWPRPSLWPRSSSPPRWPLSRPCRRAWCRRRWWPGGPPARRGDKWEKTKTFEFYPCEFSCGTARRGIAACWRKNKLDEEKWGGGSREFYGHWTELNGIKWFQT